MKTRLFEIKPLISKCFSRNDQLKIKGNKFGKLYSKNVSAFFAYVRNSLIISYWNNCSFKTLHSPICYGIIIARQTVFSKMKKKDETHASRIIILLLKYSMIKFTNQISVNKLKGEWNMFMYLFDKRTCLASDCNLYYIYKTIEKIN